jgi:sugar/nucleoside kinase (ribokinase family)
VAKPRIIAIGAGVQDVLLQGSIFKAHREAGEMMQEFSLGSKNDIENIIYSTGGGATNASVTFARQGLHSAFMGHLGHDIAGKAVIEDLHKERVGTGLVSYSDKYGTGYSTILLAPNGERTVLVYRGASEHYDITSSSFHKAQSDWFYVSTLGGNFASLQTIMKYARKNNIKVAINPGKGELKHSREFKELLPDVSILSVNKEEAAKLFHGETLEELVRHAAKHVPYVIITDGPKGSIATNGVHIYKAGMYEDVPVVDRLGAGDAFSSGFAAMVAAGHNLEIAVTFASANSTSVVSKVGAKTGILHESAKLHRMPMVITPF